MALRVWLPLNGNLNNQGLSNYQFINLGATVANNGKIGKCYSFDGSDDRIYITDFSLSEMKFSVGCWFYNTADLDSTGRYLFSLSSTNGGSGHQQLGAYLSTSGITFMAGGTSHVKSFEITNNIWYHVFVTCDGTNMTLYVNGEQIANYTNVGSVEGVNLTIGARSSNASGAGVSAAYFFKGLINDFRIYDECLSQKQIKEIAKGLVAHYKLTGVGANKNYIKNSDWSNKTNGGIYTFNGDEVTFHSDTLAASGISFSQTMDTTGITDFKNKQITFSMEYQITEALTFGTTNPWVGFEMSVSRNTTTGGSNQWLDWYGGKSIPTGVTDGWVKKSFTVSVTDYDIASLSINFYMRDTTGTIKYRHPKVEVGNVATPWIPNEADASYSKWKYGSNICTDLSGYKYNLTQVGTPVFNSDSPRYSGSTYFDGSSYLTSAIGSMSWFDFNNFTISAWFKPTVKPSNWTGSVGIQQDAGSNWKTFSISNYAGNFSVHTDNGSTWVTTQSNELPLNEWSFCTATLTNGTDLKMYINGVQVKTATIDYSTAIVRDDTRIAIGVDLPGDDEKYTGYYSDVRVYATALSADEILTMYKNSGIIDNKGNVYAYEFKEE